jgi:hypothetical protein
MYLAVEFLTPSSQKLWSEFVVEKKKVQRSFESSRSGNAAGEHAAPLSARAGRGGVPPCGAGQCHGRRAGWGLCAKVAPAPPPRAASAREALRAFARSRGPRVGARVPVAGGEDARGACCARVQSCAGPAGGRAVCARVTTTEMAGYEQGRVEARGAGTGARDRALQYACHLPATTAYLVLRLGLHPAPVVARGVSCALARVAFRPGGHPAGGRAALPAPQAILVRCA